MVVHSNGHRNKYAKQINERVPILSPLALISQFVETRPAVPSTQHILFRWHPPAGQRHLSASYCEMVKLRNQTLGNVEGLNQHVTGPQLTSGSAYFLSPHPHCHAIQPC